MGKEAFFADSCIFIGYAMEFEIFHVNCKVFFEKTEGDKYISKSVDDELKRKIKRRDDLYRDYIKYLGRNKKEKYVSTVPLNDNDKGHLKDLVCKLSNIPIIDQVNYLRNLGKILKSRINKAKSTIKDIIPRNNDVYFKDIIRTIVENDNDSWILNDAIQWSLENVYLTFVTADGDIYNDRDRLLQKVVDFKFLDKSPIGIIHIINFKI